MDLPSEDDCGEPRSSVSRSRLVIGTQKLEQGSVHQAYSATQEERRSASKMKVPSESPPGRVACAPGSRASTQDTLGPATGRMVREFEDEDLLRAHNPPNPVSDEHASNINEGQLMTPDHTPKIPNGYQKNDSTRRAQIDLSLDCSGVDLVLTLCDDKSPGRHGLAIAEGRDQNEPMSLDCEECQRKRLRCDGILPSCSHCSMNSHCRSATQTRRQKRPPCCKKESSWLTNVQHVPTNHPLPGGGSFISGSFC